MPMTERDATEPEMSRAYTIQEAAARTGLGEHTLRYYERVGLIPTVPRDDSSRHRRYTANDLRGLEFLKRLRATGMPICRMQEYVGLYQQGDVTLLARRALLEAHGRAVREHIAILQTHLAVIEYKIENYARLGFKGDGDLDACLDIAGGMAAGSANDRANDSANDRANDRANDSAANLEGNPSRAHSANARRSKNNTGNGMGKESKK